MGITAKENEIVSNIRKLVFKGIRVGQTFSVSRTFSAKDVIEFADISKDYNPVHFDERFAKAKNFEGTLCHGLLVASLLTAVGGQLGWLASGMNLKFRKPVYVDDTIKCDFTIIAVSSTGHAEAKAIFTNKAETTVLEADITGILPADDEVRIMRQMVEEGDSSNEFLGQ